MEKIGLENGGALFKLIVRVYLHFSIISQQQIIMEYSELLHWILRSSGYIYSIECLFRKWSVNGENWLGKWRCALLEIKWLVRPPFFNHISATNNRGIFWIVALDSPFNRLHFLNVVSVSKTINSRRKSAWKKKKRQAVQRNGGHDVTTNDTNSHRWKPEGKTIQINCKYQPRNQKLVS